MSLLNVSNPVILFLFFYKMVYIAINYVKFKILHNLKISHVCAALSVSVCVMLNLPDIPKGAKDEEISYYGDPRSHFQK